MPLTDSAVRNAKPGINAKGVKTSKAYKIADGGGLYLEVAIKGGKYWRLRYRFDGKQKLLSIGVYPAISLKDVRTKRGEAKEHLSQGIDPSELKKFTKQTKNLEGFEDVVREWHIKHKANWTESHTKKLID